MSAQGGGSSVGGGGVTCSDRHRRSGSQLEGILALTHHCKQMGMWEGQGF